MNAGLFYVVFGAPLLMLSAGLCALAITRLLERRERRLYDESGRARSAGSPSSH